MRQADQRGSSLLVVVWLLAIMGIIATFLIYRSAAEWAALVNSEKNITGKELAEQALYTHLAALLQDDKENDNPAEDWFGKTGRFLSEQDGYTVTVLIEDEGSKPNLNLMTENALRLLKIPDEQPVTPLLDWMDFDQKEQEDGAETPYYNSLEPAYKCRDGFFSSLQEVLQVKGGPDLYPYLEPEVTVYGKMNINILRADQFQFILQSAGFDEFSVKRAVSDFESLKQLGEVVSRNANTNSKKPERINNPTELDKLSSLNTPKKQKLKPFFCYSGIANINFMSRKGLEAVFSYASMGQIPVRNIKSLVKQLLKMRPSQPFESVDKLRLTIKPYVSLNFELKDYFTVASSLIRYRVWAEKGEQKYYLNTVQERVAGDLRTKWRARTLSWQVLTNKMVPPIPEATPFEQTLNLEDEEEDETNGTEASFATGTPPATGTPSVTGTPPTARTFPARGTPSTVRTFPVTGTPPVARTFPATGTPPAARTFPATGTPPTARTFPATGTPPTTGTLR
jgi:type II secretory pathway component PulK